MHRGVSLTGPHLPDLHPAGLEPALGGIHDGCHQLLLAVQHGQHRPGGKQLVAVSRRHQGYQVCLVCLSRHQGLSDLHHLGRGVREYEFNLISFDYTSATFPAHASIPQPHSTNVQSTSTVNGAGRLKIRHRKLFDCKPLKNTPRQAITVYAMLQALNPRGTSNSTLNPFSTKR